MLYHRMNLISDIRLTDAKMPITVKPGWASESTNSLMDFRDIE